MAGSKTITLSNLVQTNGACPSEWEADADEGERVYIRYRGGRLILGMGATIEDAIDHTHVLWHGGHRLDGDMTVEQLRERLPSWIEVSV